MRHDATGLATLERLLKRNPTKPQAREMVRELR
jgi:hypothetical protein